MNGAPDFFQFAPSAQRPDYPGVYGWGLDTHGYRIVMYGPSQADHDIVKQSYGHDPKHRPPVGDEMDIPPQYEGMLHKQSRLRPKKERPPESRAQQGEHPPAHIHVIHLQSGRETRFELIEHYRGEHTARPLYLSEKRDRNLTEPEVAAVQLILDELAPRFIQLWREMYQNKKLGRYVTRVSRYNGSEVEEHIDSKGWLVLSSDDGSVAKIPPSNSPEEHPTGETTTVRRGRESFHRTPSTRRR